MKQTAMQIMLDELLSHGYKIPLHLVVKCKELLEMEKQQIINSHLTGLIYPLEMEATKQAEQYYKETYGGNNAE